MLNFQQLKEKQEFENYTKIKLLGEGSFGKAYLIKRESDGLQCVMKMIDIQRMSENEKKEVVQEARLLEALRHPNIVHFIEVYKTKKGKLCIIMDFADGGDLQQKCKEQRGKPFAEAQILDWFTQICLGMKHIHDRKIIHRDLKGQNVFLTKKGIVQIGDLGIAKVLSGTLAKARTQVGTPYYLSPEIVQSQPYTLSTDVWSMGVMLYEMAALKPPFDAPSLQMLSMKIIRGVYNPVPPNYSQGLKNLISQCLTVVPGRRPTVNEILKMPIIQDRIKTYLSQSIIHNEFSHTILHKQNVFDQPKPLANAPKAVIQQPVLAPPPVSFMPQPKVTIAPKPQQIYDDYQKMREANAQRYLAAQPAKNVSPGMAAVLCNQGAAKPVTPGYGVRDLQPKAAPAMVAVPAPQQPQKQNYHYQAQAPQQQAQPQVKQRDQWPKYDPAKPKEQKPRPEWVDIITPEEREQNDKKSEELRAHQRKMDEINAKIKAREMELQKIDDEKLKREKIAAIKDMQKREEEYRQKMRQEQERKVYESELNKVLKNEDKKLQEQDHLKALEQARIQAFNDRKEAAARAQARKDEQDGKRFENDKEQAERRRQQEEISRKRQEEVMKKKEDLNEQKREEELKKKASFEAERAKWKKDQELKDEQRRIEKEKERQRNAAEIERIRVEKVKRQQEEQKRKDELMLNPLGVGQVKQEAAAALEPKKALPKLIEPPRSESVGPSGKAQNTIQRKANDVLAMVSQIEQNSPMKKRPKEEDSNLRNKPTALVKELDKLEQQKRNLDEDRKQMRLDMMKKGKEVRDPGVEIYAPLKPPTNRVKKQYEEMQLSPPTLQHPKSEIQERPKTSQLRPAKRPTTQDRDDQPDFDSDEDDLADDIQRSFVAEAGEEQKDIDKLLEEEFQFQKQRTEETQGDEQDAAFQMYQELLHIVRSDSKNDQETHSNATQATAPTSRQPDLDVEREDFDDEEVEALLSSKKPLSYEFSFMGKGQEDAVQLSKMQSIEHVREFLEKSLGEDVLMKAYPILLAFGDQILFEDNTEALVVKLKGLISREQIKLYQNHFALLVFFELESEGYGGGDQGKMNANASFKGIQCMTANFGNRN